MKRKNPKKDLRKKPIGKIRRPEALLVQATDISYTDILKKIKIGKEIQAASYNIYAMRKTKEGHMLIVLRQDENAIEAVSEAIIHVMGE